MIDHEVLVVGGGGAGLRAAIAAHEAGADVGIVTKLHPVRSHTGAAEGGINAAVRTADSADQHAYDTMKGADYLGDAPAIELLAGRAPREVVQLEHWGMTFARTDDGTLAQRYLAGHSERRTTYAGAETGHHLLHTLYEQVVKRGIEVYDEFYVSRLVVTDHDVPDDRRCHGVVAYDVSSGELVAFRATSGVVLATGGDGQVYADTTNAVTNTGDGQAMAYRAGVPLEDMEFVQFHPTTLPDSGVLISEGVRGEGGMLYNSEGERFMFERGYANNDGELASRDVVSRAALREIAAGRGIDDEHVLLDMRHLGEARILDRLENIVHLGTDFAGIDPVEEPIPVVPGQHYHMGGIEVDEHGRTCVEGLYAVGECACASVHGTNRLGGNALPELIVSGARAGRHVAGRDLGEAQISTGLRAVDDREPGRPGALDGVSLGGDHRGVDAAAGGDPESVVRATLADERRRIQALFDRSGPGHAAIRRDVQETMSEHANVFRTGRGLRNALDEIRECRGRYADVAVSDPSRTFNTDVVHTLETGSLIDVAEAVVLGALTREESRGAHWREDHPERNDDEWIRHTLITCHGERPTVHSKPVVLQGETRTYEPRERSY